MGAILKKGIKGLFHFYFCMNKPFNAFALKKGTFFRNVKMLQIGRVNNNLMLSGRKYIFGNCANRRVPKNSLFVQILKNA